MKLSSTSTRDLLQGLAGLLAWGRDWPAGAGPAPWVRDGQALAQDWRRVSGHLRRALAGWTSHGA